MNASHPESSNNSGATPAIFWAGSIAGVLDLSFATVTFMLRGKSFEQLLKVIAGGAFGRGALEGGHGMAVLGFVFHFCVSFGAAAVYYTASRKIAFLNRYAIVAGLVYGLLVYEFMNLVVLPLSAYHKPLAPPPLIVPDVLSHLFFVGLTIALVVRRYAKDEKRA